MKSNREDMQLETIRESPAPAGRYLVGSRHVRCDGAARWGREMADRLGWIILGAVVSGALLGATALFYLMKFDIVLPAFDPVPFLLAWSVIVLSWLLGRAIEIGRRRRDEDD